MLWFPSHKPIVVQLYMVATVFSSNTFYPLSIADISIFKRWFGVFRFVAGTGNQVLASNGDLRDLALVFHS